MNLEPLMHAYQKLSDVMHTVTSEHAKNKIEHLVIVGLRQIKNNLDRIISKLEKPKQLTLEDANKVKNLLTSNIARVNAVLSKINNLEEVSDPMLLIQHTLVFVLKPQTTLLSKL